MEILLPPDTEADYHIVIYRGNDPVGEPILILAGAEKISVVLTGTGKQTYYIINYESGEALEAPYGTIEVDFGN